MRKPSTAFPLSSGLKRPRVEAPAYLNFIRAMPCLICGAESEAAHIRFGALNYGKPGSGAGEKPSDKYCVPLCPHHHRLGNDSQHAHGGEARWWKSVGIDPILVSALLWQVSGDEAAGREICANARSIVLWTGGT